MLNALGQSPRTLFCRSRYICVRTHEARARTHFRLVESWNSNTSNR
nr:MAG TPA: hypothetical protein [Microviridae sp.]